MTRSIDDRVSGNPAILGGKPVISGTRIPVSLIENLMSHGYDVERIVQAYPSLTPDDVAAALAYAASDAKNRQSGPRYRPN